MTSARPQKETGAVMFVPGGHNNGTAAPRQVNTNGLVVIDLTKLRLGGRDDCTTVKGALWHALSGTPDGADVRLVVPAWNWWCGFAADALADMGSHIGSLTVESADPVAVAKWLQALREGSASVGVFGW